MNEAEFEKLCANIDELLGVFKQRTDEVADPRLVDCCTRIVGFYRLLRSMIVAHGGQILVLTERIEGLTERIEGLERERGDGTSLGDLSSRVAAVETDLNAEKKRSDYSIMSLEKRVMGLSNDVRQSDDSSEGRFLGLEEVVGSIKRTVLGVKKRLLNDSNNRNPIWGTAGSDVATPPSVSADPCAPPVDKRRKYELRSK